MKKVAVTGSVSSGKSIVCQFFQELGAYVISADAIVHQLLSPSTPIGQSVIQLLGPDIVENEELNREKIAKKVFKDPSLLEELEKQSHPEVQKVIKATYQSISHNSTIPLFIAEVPLLYESGQEIDYDAVIMVYADTERRQKRFIQTTPYDEAEFKRRESRLMPQEEKCQRATFVIENQGDLIHLKHEVEQTFNRFKG